MDASAAAPARAARDTPLHTLPVGPPGNDPRWHPVVRDIVDGFGAWLRLDDAVRWAPELCHLPVVHARASAAGARTPHGRKLYTLWAKDPAAYGARPTAGLWASDSDVARRLAPLEQVLVKQAFAALLLDGEPPPGAVSAFDGTLGPVEREDQWYAPGEPAGLFIMFRPAEVLAPTDAGWVYASVSAEGAITGAGRMASCMDCHTEREDRLFGLPDDG